MDYSTQGLPVHHKLLEFTQTHVHWIGDAIQPSHPLLSPSPPTFNLSQHQSFEMSQFFASGVLTLCRRTSCTVAKVLEPTTGFSTWESDKGTENPPGNLSLKAVGFDYRTSTLRKQTLGGHKKKPYVKPGPRRKSSDPTRDWARFSCECPGVSSRDMTPQWPVVRSGTLNTAVLGAVACCYNTWTRSLLPPLPLPYFGLRPNYREGIQPHQLAEN